MDDKTGALEKLKAIMAKAEQVDMSSVKIGDIIYVPLDEEDGLILKDGYKDRNKYRWVLSIPFFISCIRQQNPLTVLSKIILRKVKQFNLPPPKK